MKALKLGIIILAATALLVGFGGTGYAFHEGGVAYCDGCHTMHNSSGNAVMVARTGQPSQTAGATNAFLLQGADQSSTCLKCHAGASLSGYKVATYPVPGVGLPPLQLTPGGDFSWVQKDYSWTVPRAGSSPKDRHGHNIVAADFGFTADATLTTAPGGTYDATKLHCTSCHDPHGKYRILNDGSVAKTGLPIGQAGSYGAATTADEAVGVFRLLAGKSYSAKSYAAYSFAADVDPPVAVAPSSYNRTEGTTDTRVAYGSGMSEWCANCHSGFHNGAYPTNLRHPSGNSSTLTAAIVTNYNTYVKSGDMTGTVDTAYTSLVPFEKGSTVSRADLPTLTTSTAGAAATDNVMCLTCHRAHATGFKAMTRWNNNAELLTEAGAYADKAVLGNIADGKSVEEYQKAMYDRAPAKFAAFQRSLCNKCHAKD